MAAGLFRDSYNESKLFEEVVAFVVHDDKGREIFDTYFTDGLHAKLFEIDQLDRLDAVLGQYGRRAADGTEVKAAVLFASVGHAFGPVAFGNHNH